MKSVGEYQPLSGGLLCRAYRSSTSLEPSIVIYCGYHAYYCRISGSGKTLEVRTLACARRSLLPLAHALTAISKLSASNSQNKRHKVYTGSGHRCGVIPYSSVVWWVVSRAEDEQLQGKNSLLRRGALVLGELVWLRMI